MPAAFQSALALGLPLLLAQDGEVWLCGRILIVLFIQVCFGEFSLPCF